MKIALIAALLQCLRSPDLNNGVCLDLKPILAVIISVMCMQKSLSRKRLREIHEILHVISDFATNLPQFRQRINENLPSRAWYGKDMWNGVKDRPYEFFEVTGETPESFMEMFKKVSKNISSNPRKINAIYKLLMTLIWLRTYNTYASLSVMFDVSITDVHRITKSVWPILFNTFASKIYWPSREEWMRLNQVWPQLPGVVGAIDGTSHEIYVPNNIDERKSTYSGHRKYHCIHTQIVIDSARNIRHVHSGFFGHKNDAQSYREMPDIGPGKQLDMPMEYFLLADAIYPAKMPLLTPYRKNQLSKTDPELRKQQELYNEVHKRHRVYVEHVIAELKCYKIISSIHRHSKTKLKKLVKLCACLAQRRVDIFESV